MASPDSGSQSLPTLPQMRSLGAIRTHQHHQHQQRRREAHSATASSSSSNPSTPGDVFATLPLPAAFDVHTTHQPSMRAFMLANANGRASIQEPTPLDSARTSHTHVNLALGEDDPTFHANANVNGAASHRKSLFLPPPPPFFFRSRKCCGGCCGILCVCETVC